MDQKWSQEEQKIEADRARWLKTAPDSAKEPPKRPKKGYGAKPGVQNEPKSTQIGEKINKKLIIFLITFCTVFFFRFCAEKGSKNGGRIDQKMMKKASRRIMSVK